MDADAATVQEEAAQERILGEHPGWTAELDYARKWVVRDQYGALLGRHMDIVMAAKITADGEGRGSRPAGASPR